MKKREPIKYMKLSEDSIFKTLKIRENPNDAFDNAIKRGLDNPFKIVISRVQRCTLLPNKTIYKFTNFIYTKCRT